MKPEFSRHGIPLLGVLHEKMGAEDFQPFLSSPLYYDPDKIFYGPHQRRLGLLGFLRLDVWLNIYRSKKERGNEGNFKGDGTLLGGVYVIGPGNQGIVFHHSEEVWGDHCNSTLLMEAVKKISKEE